MTTRKGRAHRISNRIGRREFLNDVALGTAALIASGTVFRLMTTEVNQEINLHDVGRARIRVSRFVPSASTVKLAIEAAIAEAALGPKGIVDFEGIAYKVEGTVTVNAAGVTLENGGILAGEYPALSVAANNVTCRNMTFSRSHEAAVADSASKRSCVIVNAERFHSLDCRYLAANLACLYLAHGACDGAVIRGGSMTGTAVRQNACGVYAAGGSTGNRNLAIQGVRIHDVTDGILLFDTADSLVSENKIENLRKLPTVELTEWKNVGGSIWRQRTAAGAPGVDGATTDRVDGNTRAVRLNGVSMGEIIEGDSSPMANSAGIDGGYIYINLGKTDPNTQRITSDIVSGYAYTLYVTGRTGLNEPLTRGNNFVDNIATDCDGLGIYFQLGNYIGAVQNHAKHNVLKSVCLEGVQHPGLPFAGIGIVGGADTLVELNTLAGVGSKGKPVPGVCVLPGTNNPAPRGKIVSTSVRNGVANGFDISASGWSLMGCRAHNNDGSGFRVWTNTKDAQVKNVVLTNCIAADNAEEGFNVDGNDSSIGFISARILGGAAYANGRSGALLIGSAEPTVRDCEIVGMELRDNGAISHPQVSVRQNCTGTIIDSCNMTAATVGAIGLQVEVGAVETVVRDNRYGLTTPEWLDAPLQIREVPPGTR